jgi:hypothetical protein
VNLRDDEDDGEGLDKKRLKPWHSPRTDASASFPHFLAAL